EQAQADLAMVRARDRLVRCRAALVSSVRGMCKAFGTRLPSGSTDYFSKRVRSLVPSALQPAVQPLLDQIEALTVAVRDFDRRIEKVAEERYPEIALLQQVNGVGPVTATAFVLTIE